MDDLMKTVDERLAVTRAAYASALSAPGGPPPSVSFLGAELRVDQFRGVLVTEAPTDFWTVRDGLSCMRTETPAQRLVLGGVVGSRRYLTNRQFVGLAAAVISEPEHVFELDDAIACFAGLVVTEPHFHPEHELAVWVSVAHMVATGVLGNVFDELPGLVTDHDVLYREMDLDVRFSEVLMPRHGATLAEAQARLLASVLPDARGSFNDEVPRLRAYVDEHLAPAVAAGP